MAETRTIDGIKYAVCRTQADIDAAGPDADILIEFGEDADATIRKARNVRVVCCRDLRATGAKIGGDLWASGAKIGGSLWATGAKIRGDLRADGAKIGGVKVTQPTPAQVALLDQIAARVDRLNMSTWHGEGWDPSATGDCGTTHCLAGWAQALSDDPGVRKMEPKEAGKLLLPCCAHLWFAPQAIVERYLRDREFAEVGA